MICVVPTITAGLDRSCVRRAGANKTRAAADHEAHDADLRALIEARLLRGAAIVAAFAARYRHRALVVGCTAVLAAGLGYIESK